MALSGDGKHVLTGSCDKTAILWDATSGERLCSFKGHTGAVTSVALSVDGKRVLTAFDNTAILWDAASGERIRSFKGHTQSVRSVALSRNGKRILTGSSDKTAVLWDAASGDRLRSFKRHANQVNSVALSPDNRLVLTGSRDGTRLCDVATGEELLSLLSLDQGQDWLVVTPQGLFDGSPGGRQLVSFRVGKGLTVVPVDRFFQDFYRPGLFAAVMRGERPLPDADFGKQRPPLVRIASPKGGGVRDKPQVSVEVEATDQGGGVQGPWLFHNGARVLASEAADKHGKTVKRTFTVSLVQGNNRLEVNAASGDGSWESEPARPHPSLREGCCPRPISSSSPSASANTPRPASTSSSPAPDAEAVADLFKLRGKALYKEVHVTPLVDGDATRARIRTTLEAVVKKAKPQDTLLLFLAGHRAKVGQRATISSRTTSRAARGRVVTTTSASRACPPTC